MAMNRLDAAKFFTSLVERISTENKTMKAEIIYTKVFSQVSPLIINGDIDSQHWVDFSAYMFPERASKNNEKDITISNMSKEIEGLKSTLHSKEMEIKTLTKKLGEAEKETRVLSAAYKRVSTPSYESSPSVDPCSRGSMRSGGC